MTKILCGNCEKKFSLTEFSLLLSEAYYLLVKLLLLFMAPARSALALNRRGKKRGSVTYGTDREDEVSKIFIISLLYV